uniref:NADH-ubiquinone oxidoreductase chain 6 n=1 Tax=Curculionoidea sp. 22 KM-2017 TaxID=2219406 RepID=A0A346RIT1_9CUCU|nr:NADH dehydrogenase subunit 6 [Curculionoidea sp. 22 KM-2017]
MYFILMLNMTFSYLFILMNHPLSLGGILLIQTILMSLLTGFIMHKFWFSYILFLIMIGGMLIMFIYMTSIASNEKFKIPSNISIAFTILSMLTLLTLLYSLDFSNMYPLKYFNFFNFFNLKLSLNKFFNFPDMKFLLFLMIYLLITLIMVVKITDKNSGPLRQK